MRHEAWLGHGDADPDGINVNDDVTFEIVENGLDLGTPDPLRDRRTITLYLRILGATERRILHGLHVLSRWVTRAGQRMSGTVKPLTLRLGGPEVVTAWYDVREAELLGEAQALQYAARGISPVVRLILTCHAYGRGEPVPVVTDQVIDADNPVIVVPPVDTDAKAPLEIDIEDLSRGGTGINRWRLAAMPLAGDVPQLVWPLAGSATVRQDWTEVASGLLTWPEESPPPQAALLLARIRASGAIGSPIEAFRARLGAAGLDPRQRQKVRGDTLTFGPCSDAGLLVVGASASASGAFSWPAGWTVQQVVAAGGLRLEVATKPCAGQLSDNVTVVTGATDPEMIGYEVAGATGVVGVVARSSAGTLALPGGAAYQGSLAFGAARFGRNTGTVGVLSSITSAVRSSNVRYGTAHPLVEETLGAALASGVAIGTAAPGTLRFEPGTTYVGVLSDEAAQPARPAGQENEPITTSVFVPAATALLVGIVLSTAATVPSVPAGSYTLGATGVLADGSETPLRIWNTVRTAGLRPLEATWTPRAATIPGIIAWRLYYQRVGQSWRYVSVDPSQRTATIISEAGGTLGTPPQVSQLPGVEVRAVLRSAPGASPAPPLGSTSLRVGLDIPELAELSIASLPLMPGLPYQAHVTVEARASAGARVVTMDRLYDLPSYQDLGNITVELTDAHRPLAMAWTHRVDPAGRASMRLRGIHGGVSAPNGVLLSSLGAEDPDDSAWTAPRLRVSEAWKNLSPEASFAREAPTWTLDSGAAAALGRLETADALPAAGDPWVWQWRRDVSTQGTGLTGPRVPVAAGTTYTASLWLRTAPGQAAADVRQELLWYQANGTTLITTTAGVGAATGATWAQRTLTAVAPAGAAFVRQRLVWVTSSQLGGLYLDAPQVEPGSVAHLPTRGDHAVVNLLPNGSFEDGLVGWADAPAGRWATATDQKIDGAQSAKIVSQHSVLMSPEISVVPGTTYTVSAWLRRGVNFSSTSPMAIVWLLRTGSTQTITKTGPITANTWMQWVLDGVAPATAYAMRIEIDLTTTSTSGWVDAVSVQVGTSTDYAETTAAPHSRPTTGPILVLPNPALSDVTAERGRLVVRCQTFADVATVAEWRKDDANLIALTLSATQVTLTRTTNGVSQNVSRTRPADRTKELVVAAGWDAGLLRLKVHDGSAWSPVTSVVSTSWPDLSGVAWRLGNRRRLADATDDQWLSGRLVWALLEATPVWDPAADDALAASEEPIPADFPEAAGLSFIWTSTNPLRSVIWRDGGYAPVDGALFAGDGQTGLVLIGESAGNEHRDAQARVSVRAVPRFRYLKGRQP